MSFKGISYLELWRPFCSAEQNHLCKFGRRHHEEQFCVIILNLDQCFMRRGRLKIFLIRSSGGPFVQQSKILVKGIMRNNSVNYFKFEPVVQEGMSLKDISYLGLWQPLCSVEQNHLRKFGRRHHEQQFREIILNLDQCFRGRCRLKIFLIWGSGSPFVQQSKTICAISVEAIKRNNSVKLF